MSDANFIREKQRDFIRQIKQDAEPLRFGPDARYGLSIIQVDALHEAAQDNSELMQLCFDAGFSAGLAYSRDKAEQQEPKQEGSEGENMEQLRICPECGRAYNTYPAISRIDDVTEICPECGAREAIEAAQLDLETAAEILQALRDAQEAGA